MLFNSCIFIFGFLPIALLGTYAAGRWNQTAAKVALLAFSLGFYAFWRVEQLTLLLFSIGFNFIVGDLIQRAHARGLKRVVRGLLILGILVDVGMLGWFKYANFAASNIDHLFGAQIRLAHIALPLAISFFTFQKLAYLIDSARGDATRLNILDFSLFAAFFPQLIAGPIVHFKEIVPQLKSRVFGRFNGRNLMIGVVLFAIGLFKKTVIADTLSAYADPLFGAVAKGHHPGLMVSWIAGWSYTFQLYFDFSGYSDMAIGLARMLGVKLPLNFHSPLRALDIADYWRRWHMTLQRFIVAYIFQPLSLPLNRFAAGRSLPAWVDFFISNVVPIFVTFVIVGVWHGAGWTFAVFGVMHGVYLSINEAWREGVKRRRRKLRRAGLPAREPGRARIVGFHLVTLVAVIYANVMFRSASVSTAVRMWSGMTGFHGLKAADALSLNWGLAVSLTIGALLVFLMPNSQQIMGRFDPAYNWKEWRDVAKPPISWTWKPDTKGLLFAAVALFLGVMFVQRGQAVFLYFNF